MRRSSFVTVIVLLVAAISVLTTAAPALAGAPLWPAGGKWLWTNPRPQGAALNAVSLPSATRGWAVGDAGVALKTTNGGGAWSPVKLPVAPSGPYDLSDVCFVSTTRGWICDSGGGVFQTTDGGADWTLQGSGSVGCYAIEFVDAANGWLACNGFGTSILHTSDGGESWDAQGLPVTETLVDVAAITPLEAWAVGDGGKVVHTTDGGANWVAQTSTTTSDLACVTFLDAQHGWAGGRLDTVVRTTDGGANWVAGTTSHAFHVVEDLAFDDAQNGVAVLSFNDGWQHDGQVVVTNDGAATWVGEAVSTSDSSLLGAAVQPGGGGIVVGTGGGVWRRAGGFWTRQTQGAGWRLNDVDMATAATGWACGYKSGIWHTTDGGKTWGMQAGGGGGRYNDVWTTSTLEAHAVGSAGIVHTLDGGTLWAPEGSPPGGECQAVSFFGAQDGWTVAQGGGIQHTTDAGAHWGPQAWGGTTDLWDVWAIDAQKAVAVGDGGLILRTTDAGANWGTPVSGTVKNLYGVCFSGTTEGWAVGLNSDRIVHTTDGGATWAEQTVLTSGVTDFRDVSFATPQVGWVAGDDAKLYATTDGGLVWEEEKLACAEKLFGVDAVSPEAVYAAGDNGMIVARDGARPTTSAPSRATVRRGGTARLKYKVNDAFPNSGFATVTVKIRTRAGKVVKTLKLGTKQVGKKLTATFRCKLKKGAYLFTVYATDTVGNMQSRADRNRLVVK